MATVGELLKKTRLERLDAELLLAWILKKERSFILAHPESPLSRTQEKHWKELTRRRMKAEPVAYITGVREFYGRPFLVNRSTLIPRPETEILVEAALKRIIDQGSKNRNQKKIAVVDVGTGSGAIIVTLAKELNSLFPATHYSLFATDVSRRALRMAEKNAGRLDVLEKISFFHTDLLEDLDGQLASFESVFVLANLPYLSEDLYQKTALDVRNYEPRTALLSGQDGLDHYRRLFAQLKGFSLSSEIFFFLEISPEQTDSVRRLLGPSVEELSIQNDLAGLPRLVVGLLP